MSLIVLHYSIAFFFASLGAFFIAFTLANVTNWFD